MSDIATVLQEELIKTLKNENGQLQALVNNFSGTLRAQKQALGEFLEANISLKGSLILLDEQVKRLTAENLSLKERCEVLEKEKTACEKVIEDAA